jgi:hypothetical protein
LSHFTTIRAKIVDKECLIEALRKLYSDFSVHENVPIKGYRGRKRQGDVVLKTHRAYDVGFIKDPSGTYLCVADWYGAARAVNRNHKQFLNNLQKEYAVSKVIKTVTKKGFRVQSRMTSQTGEIKLVGQDMKRMS